MDAGGGHGHGVLPSGHRHGCRGAGPLEWVIGCDLLYTDTEPVYPDLVNTLLLLCRHGRTAAASVATAAVSAAAAAVAS